SGGEGVRDKAGASPKPRAIRWAADCRRGQPQARRPAPPPAGTRARPVVACLRQSFPPSAAWRAPCRLEEENEMLVKPEEVGLSSSRLGRISDHLQRYIDAGKLTGTLTLVARRGKIAYFEPQGHLEIERKRPVTPDAIFRIYSMTKPIVSVGLMMLWEQGRVQLDDPVGKFIPSWRDQRVFVGGNHPAWKTTAAERPMTIRDLLSHTSGLTYGFMERTNVDAAYRNLGIADRTRAGYTLRDMNEELAALPLEFSPGTRWNYSVSTDVVGYLIEAISGQRLDAYLREHVLQPLGMTDTSFVIRAEQVERFAANYQRQADDGLKLIDDP